VARRADVAGRLDRIDQRLPGAQGNAGHVGDLDGQQHGGGFVARSRGAAPRRINRCPGVIDTPMFAVSGDARGFLGQAGPVS
jgi:hypothetical protein